MLTNAHKLSNRPVDIIRANGSFNFVKAESGIRIRRNYTSMNPSDSRRTTLLCRVDVCLVANDKLLT